MARPAPGGGPERVPAVIGICADSSSQVPPDLARRHGIEVVPMTVEFDGQEFLDGVDLDLDAYYACFAQGRHPSVAVSAPSPGQFAVAYDELAARGCSEILSLHAGVSGAANPARLAARTAPVPVRLLDTTATGFAVACEVWRAARVLEAGGSLDDAAAACESVRALVRNVFVASGPDVVLSGTGSTSDHPGVPVLTVADGALRSLGAAGTVAEVVDAMVGAVLGADTVVDVAVGVADPRGGPLADALVDRLVGHPCVDALTRYRVGPSAGGHAGPGTVGLFWFPA